MSDESTQTDAQDTPSEQSADTIDVDARINKAITNHLSRFKKSLAKETQETLSGLLDPIVAQITEMREAPRQDGDSVEHASDGDTDKYVKKLEAERKRFEAERQKWAQELEAERQQREDEKAKRLRDEERSALTSALHDAGVTGAAARAATALLYTEENRVRRDDDGSIVFVASEEWGEVELGLTDGLKKWLDTDDGKTFMPPRGTSGSGAAPSARPPQSTAGMSPVEQAMAALEKGLS